MPTVTDYSGADVLAQLLINAGQCSDWTSRGVAAGDWPVSVNEEPGAPDDVVTIYDTESSMSSFRDNVSGVEDSPSGFMVRVRASTRRLAYSKASTLMTYLSGSVLNTGVSVEDKYYDVEACLQFGDILDNGRDPDSRRHVVTFNADVIYTDLTS